MPSQHDFERQINQVLNELSKIQGIDPSAFNQVKKDVDALQRNISMNAKEFKSTTSDIKDLRKAMMNAVGIIEEQSRILHNNAAQSIKLKTFADKLRAVQDNIAKYAAINVDALKDNDNAIKEQSKYIRQDTRQKKRADAARQREEERYIKRLKELNEQRELFRARITGNIDKFSRSEDIKYDKAMLVAENNRRSLTRRRSSGIAANVLDDIPNFVLSKIRVKTASAKGSTDKNLFQQLQDLNTFQAASKIPEARKNLLNVAQARASNPLVRIYKAMDIEAKSPRSRLAIVNLFRNAFVRPIKVALKTAGTVFRNALIGLLNAPFKILSKIGSSFNNVFGDIFTRITKGKDALNKKIETRNIKKSEESIVREEDFNDRLGIGVEKLSGVLEEYLKLISSAGIQNSSNQFNLNEISKVETKIKEVERKRNFDLNFKKGLSSDNTSSGISKEYNNQSKELKTDEMSFIFDNGNFKVDNADIVITNAKSMKDNENGFIKVTSSDKMPQNQEAEQKAEQEMKIQDERNKILEDIKNSLTEGDTPETKNNGIFGTIRNLFKGGIFKNLLKSLKGFGPKLLTALGLSSSGGLLASGKNVLKAAGRVAPWAAAVYAVAKAFQETSDEFVDQGSAIDNGLERFRLFSQNLVTAIPGLVDSVAAMIGVQTNFKNFIDGIFDQLNRIGSALGNKSYDLFEVFKSKFTGSETPEEVEARLQHQVEFNRKVKKEIADYIDNNNKESSERDIAIEALEKPFSKIKYNPKNMNRDPFAPLNQTNNDMDSLPIRVTSADTGKHRKGSKHGKGMAIDLTPPGFGGLPYTGKPLKEENKEAFAAYERTAELLRGMGLKVVDEYSAGGKTSQFGSARHIHVEGSKEQIQDLINRAEIVKPGAVSAAPNLKDMKTREMLASSRAKLNKSMRKAQTEKKEMPSGTPVSINVPAPKVIMDKDLDGSFNGWMAIQQMHA